MYCQKCGSAIRDGAKFCHSCGEPVRQVSQVPSPKPKNDFWLWGVAAVIVVGILFVGYSMLNQIRNSGGTSDEDSVSSLSGLLSPVFGDDAIDDDLWLLIGSMQHYTEDSGYGYNVDVLCTFKYDELGRKVYYEADVDDGNEDEEIYMYEHMYTYNDNGDVEIHTFRSLNSDRVCLYENEYEYNAQGDVLICYENVYDSKLGQWNSETQYQYDETGNLILEVSESDDGEESERHQYTYDSFGRLIRDEREKYNESVQQWVLYNLTIYDYDEYDRVRTEHLIETWGTSFDYDEIQSVWYDATGTEWNYEADAISHTDNELVKYTYDDAGNVLQKSTSSWDAFTVFVCKDGVWLETDSSIEENSAGLEELITYEYDDYGNLVYESQYVEDYDDENELLLTKWTEYTYAKLGDIYGDDQYSDYRDDGVQELIEEIVAEIPN
jgi:hypothetical protein